MGDDTPPYMSQIAKDIVTFLRYSTDVSKVKEADFSK